MSVDHQTAKSGTLRTARNWPEVPVEKACEITGGEPFAWLGETPVGAVQRCGKGEVIVIGFGSRFTDASMGVTGDAEPSDDLRKIYDVEYALLRWIIDPNAPPPAKKPIGGQAVGPRSAADGLIAAAAGRVCMAVRSSAFRRKCRPKNRLKPELRTDFAAARSSLRAAAAVVK